MLQLRVGLPTWLRSLLLFGLIVGERAPGYDILKLERGVVVVEAMEARVRVMVISGELAEDDDVDLQAHTRRDEGIECVGVVATLRRAQIVA